MTMLLFARPLLSAIAPLLAAASDSTPITRTATPVAPMTVAMASLPAPAPADPIPSDGRVPMPAWALGAHTGIARAGRADSIVVEKSEHRMTLYAHGESLGTFLVAIGKQPVGAKEQAGDYRTPEGLYRIDRRNPNSRYHLALHVSYPNATDVAHARALGVSPGGDVMIHGLPNGQGSVGAEHREYDWTNGCVAVTDQEIEQIWNAVPVGTPIRIKP